MAGTVPKVFHKRPRAVDRKSQVHSSESSKRLHDRHPPHVQRRHLSI